MFLAVQAAEPGHFPPDVYELDWYTVDSGGSSLQTSGAYALYGTAGQPEAVHSINWVHKWPPSGQGQDYSLYPGFLQHWPEGGASADIADAHNFALLDVMPVYRDLEIPGTIVGMAFWDPGGNPAPEAHEHENDESFLLWTKEGLVYSVYKGQFQREPVLDMRDAVNSQWDRGLLGLAVPKGYRPDDPDPQHWSAFGSPESYSTVQNTSWVYISYTVNPHWAARICPYDDSGCTPGQHACGLLAPYDPSGPFSWARVQRFRTMWDVVDEELIIRVVPGDSPLEQDRTTGHAYEAGDYILLDRIPSITESHTIGTVAFALDGSLLVGTGDGAHFGHMDAGGHEPAAFANSTAATQRDAEGNYSELVRFSPADDSGAFRAQDPRSLSGKILRIDPVPKESYRVSLNPHQPLWAFEPDLPLEFQPEDAVLPALGQDPFWPHGEQDDIGEFYRLEMTRAVESVFAMGLRNPYRFSVRPGTSPVVNGTESWPGEVWIGDVGNDVFEEINVIRHRNESLSVAGGENFGWPNYHGIEPQAGPGPDPGNPWNGHHDYWTVHREPDVRKLPGGGLISADHTIWEIGPSFPKGVEFRHTLPQLQFTHPYASAIVGGVFSGSYGQSGTYPHIDPALAPYPAAFQDVYFFGDYGAGWIDAYDPQTGGLRDGHGGPLFSTAELEQAGGASRPLCFDRHPVTGEIYFVSIGSSSIFKIRYDGKRPVAGVRVQAEGNQVHPALLSPVTLEATSRHVRPSANSLVHEWHVVEVSHTSYDASGMKLDHTLARDLSITLGSGTSDNISFDPQSVYTALDMNPTPGEDTFRFRIRVTAYVEGDPSLHDTADIDIWRGNQSPTLPMMTYNALSGNHALGSNLLTVPDVWIVDADGFASNPLGVVAGEPVTSLPLTPEFESEWQLDLFHWQQSGHGHAHSGAGFCSESNEFLVPTSTGHGGGGDEFGYAVILRSHDLDGLPANSLHPQLEALRITYIFDKGFRNLFPSMLGGFFYLRPTTENHPFLAKGLITPGAPEVEHIVAGGSTTLPSASFSIVTQGLGVGALDQQIPEFRMTIRWDLGEQAHGNLEALVWMETPSGQRNYLCTGSLDCAVSGASGNLVLEAADIPLLPGDEPRFGVASNQTDTELVQKLEVWIEPILPE